MSKKGESVINAIRYVDSFFSDLSMMFNNLESILHKNNFISIPNAGNYAAPYHVVSSHIGTGDKWLLKSIQRMYLDENLSKSDNYDSAILCSVPLFEENLFDFPVLTCGVLRWNNKYSASQIYERWDSFPIRDVVCDKSVWRFGKDKENNGKIYHLYPEIELRDLKNYSLFFIDLVKIENSTILEEIVNAAINFYKGNEDLSLDDDLFVKKIPQKLIETWSQPVSV